MSMEADRKLLLQRAVCDLSRADSDMYRAIENINTAKEFGLDSAQASEFLEQIRQARVAISIPCANLASLSKFFGEK